MHMVAKVSLTKTGRHQKILLGEQLPLSAWYAEVALKHAYIKVAVMHSGLSQFERAKLADAFNDRDNDLMVLILLSDVSIVSMNLHLACSTVIVMTIFRNLALEIQFWGRAFRVRSPTVESTSQAHELTFSDYLH